MIAIPERGLSGTIEEGGVDLDVLCDWIEGSVAFMDGELSQIDVVDALMEEERCRDQDAASLVVKDAWIELERRDRLCGRAYGLEVEGDWLRTVEEDGNEGPTAYAFCLLVSLAAHYQWWHREFGKDYTEQGELFELLTEQALQAHSSPIWKVFRTGWGRQHTVKLREVVEEVAERIGTIPGDFENWDRGGAKEMGLDILWYMDFSDGRGGVPHCLVQCASGRNWREKTPNVSIWGDLVKKPFSPMAAMSVPFCFSDDTDFRNHCVRVNDGVLLDRVRLMGAGRQRADWIGEDLAQRFRGWMRSRVERLLVRSE